MKILIFIPHMGQGGVERSFINLSIELIKKSHDVKFVCLNKPKSVFSEELSVIKLNSRRTLFSMIKLSKVIEYETPDILISAQYYANIAAIISKKICLIYTLMITFKVHLFHITWLIQV